MSSAPTLSFSLTAPSLFGPRTGSLTLRRHGNQSIRIDTPGLMVSTSRGIVPHISRDHHKLTPAIRWVHVPFETFLESNPPVPTKQPGPNPLHTFLGYSLAQHIVALSLRDPANGRQMPANGNDYITSYSAHGVKKVTPAQWRSYVRACTPDIVVALPDIPFTGPPYSQKRTTKSIDRSATWLANILSHEEDAPPLNILVHMAGGISAAARHAFTDNLTETLHGKEAESVRPFKCLNDGVAGYIFDLLPIRQAMDASADTDPLNHPAETISLLKASLKSGSSDKLRVVNCVESPHQALRLIRDVGIDVFDSKWAQDAANVGVALDFTFPVQRSRGKRDLGHNLYQQVYSTDFSAFADCFIGGAGAAAAPGAAVCPCAACSPLTPATAILHSTIDEPRPAVVGFQPPFTRAYLHHLLQTHEMSAHSLLAMHNLAVLDAFFAGVRAVLERDGTGAEFTSEVDTFCDEYDESMATFVEARTMWKEVDVARGKGRLGREKANTDGD
ncbi:tRNA-guanine(15) transglycosylase-like protein [Mycena rebaudengoi]|nr:tRNA-guanine(15) transglycosylase-like protein [Mycena rebaudengoi]